MTSESVALRLHAEASADAALASALRAAYRGRHDVLDALWWRAHPLAVTPGGRPDPAAELPRLQSAVYARPGPTGSAVESERRLHALTAQLRQDESDLDAVLVLFRDAVRSGGALPRPAPGTPPAPGVPGSPGAADATVRAPRALRTRTLRRSALLVAAGVLVGGIAVAMASVVLPHGGPASGPGTEPAASASPGLLALFDQPPIPDQTTIDLGPDFRRDSIHAMFVERETSSFVYVAARRGDELYCVILRTQGQQGASACVGLAELARRGLALTATVPVNPFTLGKDSLEPAGALADVTIRVSTDGVVSSETAPHPTD
ncbi:hypothetical protein KIV56_06495 [Cryobacterium breve]|uniref:Anti-sigma factor n=1 Tax=Cryobacterium breve TaxID=1259258 RepID=A0ABY7NKA9_9MICO|nr:hypothetical protein [Cryobacterium breve]WBM80938.1 hypothetical protein KIV56_06495 [Cryobacterium breve]